MKAKLPDPSINEAAVKLQNRVYIDPRLLSRFKALNSDSLRVSVSALNRIKDVFNISKIRILLDKPEEEKGFQQIYAKGDTLARGLSVAITKTAHSQRHMENTSDFHYSDEIEVDVYIDPELFTNLFQDKFRNIDYKKLNDPKYFAEIFNKLVRKEVKREGLLFNTADFFSQKYFYEFLGSILVYLFVVFGSALIVSRGELDGAVWYLLAAATAILMKIVYSKTNFTSKLDATYTFPMGMNPDLIVRTILIMLEDLKIIYFKES